MNYYIKRDRMKLDPIKISERISIIMQNLNYSQKEFARYLSITQPAISKYLNGRIPPAGVLLHIALIAKTNIEWILTGKTAIKQGNVAEPPADYHTKNNLARRIESLPKPLRNQIENLIDEFCKIVKK